MIDEIILGFGRQKGNNSVNINIVFDLSNTEALISENIVIDEVKDFRKKAEELGHLDYKVKIKKGSNVKKYQWLFFEMILLDRNGERYKIDNRNNKIRCRKVECPLFSVKKRR